MDICAKIFTIAAMIVLWILVLFALGCLYSALQSALYNDYSIMLPPYKNTWIYNWKVHSEGANDDSIVCHRKITYECPRCRYISDVASCYCPNCGCYFSNYDLNWQSKLKVCNSVFEKEG